MEHSMGECQLRPPHWMAAPVQDSGAECRHLGSGASSLLGDSDKLLAAVAGFTALALGVYSAREGTRVAGRVFERYVL